MFTLAQGNRMVCQVRVFGMCIKWNQLDGHLGASACFVSLHYTLTCCAHP